MNYKYLLVGFSDIFRNQTVIFHIQLLTSVASAADLAYSGLKCFIVERKTKCLPKLIFILFLEIISTLYYNHDGCNKSCILQIDTCINVIVYFMFSVVIVAGVLGGIIAILIIAFSVTLTLHIR